MGLTDAGQARYRQIRGALDEITTRLVEAADKMLAGPGKVKLPLLCRYFFLVGRLAGRVSAPVCEEHASGANPEGRGLTVMDTATQTLPVARGP